MTTLPREPIGRIAEVLMGQSPPSAVCVEHGPGLPFIQGNAEFGVRHPQPVLRCSEPTRIAEPGDMLLSVRAPVGEVNEADRRMVIGRGLSAIRVASDDRNYAWHSLRWSASGLNRVAQGSTFVAVSRKDVERLLLPWPSKEERQRVAGILDLADAAIQNAEMLIQKARHIRVGMIDDLLSRGLDEDGKVRDARVRAQDFVQSPLGLRPSDWETVPFGQYVSDWAVGPRFSGDLYSKEGNVATLRTTDMDDQGQLSLSTMPLARIAPSAFAGHFLRRGDLLVSRSGTCGIAAVFIEHHLPVLPGAFLLRFRFSPRVNPEYARLYFNSPVGRARLTRIAEGGVQKNIRGTSVLPLLLSLPSREEQDAILARVELCDREIELERQTLAKLKGIKQALLTDLLTGYAVESPQHVAAAEAL